MAVYAVFTPLIALAVACLWAVGLSLAVGSLPAVAPDFTLTLLDGRPLSLSDLRGKPLVVNFWWSQ